MNRVKSLLSFWSVQLIQQPSISLNPFIDNSHHFQQSRNKPHNTMAPVIKQTLLPLGMFVKNPKVSTKKKHKKLERRSECRHAIRKKPFVDKKRQQRIQEEKDLAEGAEGWRRYLDRSGDPDADTTRTDIMFQAFGPAPNPINGRSNGHQDENHVDFVAESKSTDKPPTQVL